MTVREILDRMNRYFSVINQYRVEQKELMEFAEWLSEQKFTVTDEIRPEQFPHPKNNLLFQIACQTGVLKKVYVVRCPVCGEKIGMYMEKDKDLMPSKSVCLNKHIFDTFQSAENNVVYCIKEKVAHIYY